MRLALDWRARAAIHRSANGSAARGWRGRGRGTLWYCYTSVCLSICCKLWPLAARCFFLSRLYFCIVNHLTSLLQHPLLLSAGIFLQFYISLMDHIPCDSHLTTVCWLFTCYRLFMQTWLAVGKCLMMTINPVDLNVRLELVLRQNLLYSLYSIKHLVSDMKNWRYWLFRYLTSY